MTHERFRATLSHNVDAIYAATVLFLALASAAITGHSELFSRLGQLSFLRQFAMIGLLTLGQQSLLRHRDLDLGAPAQIALATVLVIGLGSAWGLTAGVLAAIAVGQVVALGCGLACTRRRLPSAWVTLLPLVAVPAILPQTATSFAPGALEAVAIGDWAGLPHPVGVWLLLFVLAALVWRHITRRLGFVLAGLCWSAVGLIAAGRAGTISDLTPWLSQAGLGLGLAMLVAARPQTSLLAGALLAAAASVLLEIGVAGAATLPIVAGLALLGGLAARSTDAENLDIGPAGGRIDRSPDVDPHGQPPDLAGLEQPDGQDV